MPKQLSKKQNEVLQAIRRYRWANSHSPTLTELAQMLGVRKQTVHAHVQALKRKGWLIQGVKGSARTLVPLTGEDRRLRKIVGGPVQKTPPQSEEPQSEAQSEAQPAETQQQQEG